MAWMIVLTCLGIIFVIGRNLQSEIAPIEDKGMVRLQITGPEGASYPYMMENGNKIANYLIDSIPETDFASPGMPPLKIIRMNRHDFI